MSAPAIPSTVQNPVTLNLSPSYGALIVAAYLGCALWGINVMQTYIYYWNYPDDSWALKTLVAFLLIVDTAHKILITKIPWFTLIQNWGRVSAILASPEEALHEAWVGSSNCTTYDASLNLPPQPATPETGGFGPCSLSLFFFPSRRSASWLSYCLPERSLTTGMLIAYLAFSIGRANIFIPVNLRLKRAGLIGAAVVDLFIAVGMIILVRDSDQADSRALRSKRTSRTISRLTVIIINTGVLTAAVAIISLILDETASGTDFWTAIAQYPQCSIYLSAFLANLNARRYIRGDGEDTTTSNMEDIRFAHNTTLSRDAEASKANRTDTRIVLGPISSGTHSSGTEADGSNDLVLNLEKYNHPAREDSEVSDKPLSLEVV
ncbi:uncharacterized protein PHACADRAFT_199773 [Phanerochaete carnosa HHB-10118-sp]|uniref:DUF6534 domain-containing protein n=1 Tax=Phanerochaete carnosa (strain HHB-10118-sp) TaxID=650164 RepID=K5WKZ7_PHACS|nr:uncharacterized protein PHACADRAFT_199773 [Phanerochaete carnosa HHB-10118-sp]EKM50937.1 hypothetical protein PHACADRAFT_199773 [Phanerochaete carnosa HHB-10118-sp]